MVSVVLPVTAAASVSVPEVAVRLSRVAGACCPSSAPEVVKLPVLPTVIPPPVSVMPVTLSVPTVFVNCTLPLVLLSSRWRLAYRVAAPLSVVPVAELVDRGSPTYSRSPSR